MFGPILFAFGKNRDIGSCIPRQLLIEKFGDLGIGFVRFAQSVYAFEWRNRSHREYSRRAQALCKIGIIAPHYYFAEVKFHSERVRITEFGEFE